MGQFWHGLCSLSAIRARLTYEKLIQKYNNDNIYLLSACTVTPKDRDRERFFEALNTAKSNKQKLFIMGCHSSPEQHILFDQYKDDLIFLSLKDKNDFIGTPVEDTIIWKNRLYVNIQDGCNLRCTYCIIWKMKDASVSLSPDKIISLIEEKINLLDIPIVSLVANDYCQYKYEDKEFYDLLLILIDKFPNAYFILDLVFNPIMKDLDKIFELIANRRDKFILSEIGLGIQSMSDKILNLMKRGYTSERINELLNILEKNNLLNYLRCDIIVGFPGETEEDYNESLKFVKKYNPVEGIRGFIDYSWAEAHNLPNKIDQNIINRRHKLMKKYTRKRGNIQKDPWTFE